MKKLTLILLFGLFLKAFSQNQGFCDYVEDPVYTCLLSDANLAEGTGGTDDDMEGTHLNSRNSSDVKVVKATGAVSGFMLQKLFNNFQNLEIMEFPNGQIRTAQFDSNYFYNCEKLKRLLINLGNVANVPVDTFKNCPALEELDLSSNSFESLLDGSFNGLPALKKLILRGNDFTTLNVNVFSQLQALETLDLGDNDIDSLGDRIFVQNKNLKELILFNNTINQLQTVVFDQNQALEILDMSYNRINRTQRGFFNSLNNLKTAKFLNNPCIDQDFDPVNKDTLVSAFEQCFLNNGSFRIEAFSKSIIFITAILVILKAIEIL